MKRSGRMKIRTVWKQLVQLPYYLNGMDMGVRSGEVEEAARKAGFTRVETHTEVLCTGEQDVHILRK